MRRDAVTEIASVRSVCVSQLEGCLYTGRRSDHYRIGWTVAAAAGAEAEGLRNALS